MYNDSILFIQLYPNFIIFLLSRFHYLDLKFLTATVTVHFIQLLQQVTSSFHSTSPAIQTATHEMNKLWNAGKKLWNAEKFSYSRVFLMKLLLQQSKFTTPKFSYSRFFLIKLLLQQSKLHHPQHGQTLERRKIFLFSPFFFVKLNWFMFSRFSCESKLIPVKLLHGFCEFQTGQAWTPTNTPHTNLSWRRKNKYLLTTTEIIQLIEETE